MNSAEVRPQPVCDEDLRVRNLPQQKIRNPLLSRGSNHQVRIRHVCRVQRVRDVVLVQSRLQPIYLDQVLQRAATRVRFCNQGRHNRPRRVHNLRSRSIVQCQSQRRAGIPSRRLARPLHRVLHLAGQLADAPDVLHAHIVVVHPLHIPDQVAAQQLHQEVDLGLRPPQIVLE